MSAELRNLDLRNVGDDYKYGFRDKEDYEFKSGRGLTREIVEKISAMKKSRRGC
jgi:Fe-S cluster assembly protein SufB